MLERIKEQVALGFAEPAEIVDDAVDYFSDKSAPRNCCSRSQNRLVKTAIAKHLAAAGELAGRNRLRSTGQRLCGAGTERHLLPPGSHGLSDLWTGRLDEEMQDAVQAGGMPRGYCFFHHQDTDRVIETGQSFPLPCLRFRAWTAKRSSCARKEAANYLRPEISCL